MGGAKRALMCDQFHDDKDVQRKRGFVHCHILNIQIFWGLKQFFGFEHMSGFKVKSTFVFVHEAPGLAELETLNTASREARDKQILYGT